MKSMILKQYNSMSDYCALSLASNALLNYATNRNSTCYIGFSTVSILALE